MKATYVLPMNGNEVDVPPFKAVDGVQLHYTEDGALKGGYSCVSVVPTQDSAIVLIDGPQAVHDWLAANRVLVEVLSDEPDGP